MFFLDGLLLHCSLVVPPSVRRQHPMSTHTMSANLRAGMPGSGKKLLQRGEKRKRDSPLVALGKEDATVWAARVGKGKNMMSLSTAAAHMVADLKKRRVDVDWERFTDAELWKIQENCRHKIKRTQEAIENPPLRGRGRPPNVSDGALMRILNPNQLEGKIRVHNGLDVDEAFEACWQSAVESGRAYEGRPDNASRGRLQDRATKLMKEWYNKDLRREPAAQTTSARQDAASNPAVANAYFDRKEAAFVLAGLSPSYVNVYGGTVDEMPVHIAGDKDPRKREVCIHHICPRAPVPPPRCEWYSSMA